MDRLAVFDLDGTLVDTAPDLTASLNHCLAADGLSPVAVETVRREAGHGARAMLRAAYAHHDRTITPEAIEAHLPAFLAHYEANIAVVSRPFPGADAAMDGLAAAGWRLAVCTNKRTHLAVKLLTELGLAPRFSAICGADRFAGMKPDPAHLLGTITEAGARREASIMIGDTKTDVLAARNAGVPCVLVDFGYVPDTAAREKASVVIERYGDLTPALAESLCPATEG